MKISYRTHPILEMINSGLANKIGVIQEDFELWNKNNQMMYFHSYIQNYFKPFLKKEKTVFKVSDSFKNAIDLNKNKLATLIHDFTIGKDQINIDINDIFILDDFVYFFDFHCKKNEEDTKYSFFIFTKEGCLMAFNIEDVENKVFQHRWCSLGVNIKQNESNINKFLIDSMALIFAIYFFKQYAEVETKYLDPKKKQIDINCKYINETNTGITILDSKWFTTLVKSDSFKVRGHFRLQPYGEELKQRKLIWINDFEKDGYTAKAKILKQ